MSKVGTAHLLASGGKCSAFFIVFFLPISLVYPHDVFAFVYQDVDKVFDRYNG